MRTLLKYRNGNLCCARNRISLSIENISTSAKARGSHTMVFFSWSRAL